MSHQRRFDSWQLLQAEFEHACQDLEKMRFEAEEEARARANREARNRANRRDLDDVDRIPFQGERETDLGRSETANLRYFHQTALDCIPELRTLFENKAVDLHFLKVWGAFQLACGYVLSRVESPWDAMERYRSEMAKAATGSNAARQRSKTKRQFVATLITELMKNGRDRPKATKRAALVIHAWVVKAVSLSDPTAKRPETMADPETNDPIFAESQVDFLRSLIMDEKVQLKATFTNKMSASELRELAGRKLQDSQLRTLLPQLCALAEKI